MRSDTIIDAAARLASKLLTRSDVFSRDAFFRGKAKNMDRRNTKSDASHPNYIPGQASLSDQEFQLIRKLVLKHTHISLGDNKRELVRTRLGKILRTRHFDTFMDYYQFLSRDDVQPDEIEELANAISTNLTSFFRESKHFDYISHQGLPALLARKQLQKSTRLRAWSAGCSSGEEAYSLAITLLEAHPPLREWDFRILATDIDTNVLEKGKRGIYEKRQTDNVPPMLRRKYFQFGTGSKKNLFRVQPFLRELVVFKRLNLMESYPFQGPFDYIFCRNVMIYFDKITQGQIVRRFFDMLAPGGCLFVGHSESLTGIEHGFGYVQPTVYSKP